MYLPAALHGIEPLCLLLIAYESFGPLFVVLFGPVVNPLLMLVLFLACLMGPLVVTHVFCVVWFRFRLLRRYLALWPAEVGRIYRIWGMVGEGLSWAWSSPSSFS